MKTKKNIVLKAQKDESVKRFHPWIFSGAIAQKDHNIKEGDHVRVMSAAGDFLGTGHYQEGSIAVRILSFGDKPINSAFYQRRIEEAYAMRVGIGLKTAANNSFRLIHGEGDNLPGLIIDLYGKTAVMQSHSLGMDADKEHIVAALRQVLGDDLENIFYKSESTLPFKNETEGNNQYLFGGESAKSVALENGISFHIDWLKGQKTGFFIDQRDNRSLLEKYAFGKSVLNMFCYTGGFSVYAMRGGAKLVHSVDSSAKAISLTDKNIRLNFGEDTRHQSFEADAFKHLRESEKDTYDLIVLDPPAFAKHRSAITNALQGYKRLNLAAMEKIRKNG